MMRDNMRHHIKDGTFNPQDKKIKKSWHECKVVLR
jgi:hypothetical protein